MTEPITFQTEIKKVSSKKLASLDVEYNAILASSDMGLYQLGTLPADCLVKVEVTPL